MKTSGLSFSGFKQWWAALAGATSSAPTSGRHKCAACAAQTHGNSASATAAASPSSPKPPLSSESQRKREDSAECSKFKHITFIFFVQGCNMFGDIVPPASPWCSIQMVLRESGEGRGRFIPSPGVENH